RGALAISRGLRRVGAHLQARLIDCLEVRAGDTAQLFDQLVVVPALVGRAGDIPVRAVVGQDHAVGLERLQNDLGIVRERRYIEAGLEAEALAQRRHARTGLIAGVVARGPDVFIAGD